MTSSQTMEFDDALDYVRNPYVAEEIFQRQQRTLCIHLTDSCKSATPEKTREFYEYSKLLNLVTIAILDAQQASDLMLKMEAGEGIDRVRVTIYDLPLNQLVWLGWILMVGGSLVVLTTTPRVRIKEDE